MNKLELQEIITARLEILAILGNPIPIQIKELKIEAGDYITPSNYYTAGMTTREVSTTEYFEENGFALEYLRGYWICEWSGNPNWVKNEYIERNKKRTDFLKKQAILYGPPKGYSEKTFEGFISHNEKMKDILTKIYNWPSAHVSEISPPMPPGGIYLNLLLVGARGTGKTHLAALIFNWTLFEDEYAGVQFIDYKKLIRKFKEKERKESALVRHYGEGKSYSDEPMDSGCEILIIDDLAADSDQYFIDILNEILSRRVSADLYTVITTNLDKARLIKLLGDRGASLLFHRCLIAPLAGPDYRLIGHVTDLAKKLPTSDLRET